MKTVWKFTVPIDDNVHTVPMPLASRILFVGRSAQNTDREVSFWAEVTPGSDVVERHFRVIGTGHDIGASESVVATYAGPSEYFVWHLLERAE